MSIMEARQSMTSFESKLSDSFDEDSQTWGDVIPDSINYSPDIKAELSNNKDSLNKILKKLTLRERSVIVRRFGINDKDFETLENIGDSVGVTRERIRQIEEKAIRKLRMLVRDEFEITTDEKQSTFMFKF